MFAEVAWVLVSSGTQVQPQIILDPDYLPDYLSVFYDYSYTQMCNYREEFVFRTISNQLNILKYILKCFLP